MQGFKMLDMAKRGRGRPPKAEEDKADRDGRSYTGWYDYELWARLERYMDSLRIRGDYIEHIESALKEYLDKYEKKDAE